MECLHSNDSFLVAKTYTNNLIGLEYVHLRCFEIETRACYFYTCN